MLARALVSRALLQRSIKNTADNLKQAKRNGSHGVWTYRVPPPMPRKTHTMYAEIIGAGAWWWICWHILTEPEHIYGEWPYVDPSTYTDEELGIPSDSQGPLRRI